ncbi:uncharacterized protein BDR25DRAFT_363265 [Lindgomyces ingoldianus]|uniref:Uncharacterized protein n=1 Tax=Lindgomyces ingoldianus TaxID=673940 RepID=A0ACB6Q7U2_9PLEO|nr:uncharacterized protein BDR25DRAFT_363265 [Lindgomyces ingoldianus]KAF2462949.1 hypothetical protein BDR25DRAFT_363265 [Lindgomyces ingoldianus]
MSSGGGIWQTNRQGSEIQTKWNECIVRSEELNRALMQYMGMISQSTHHATQRRLAFLQFRQIQVGRDTGRGHWKEFELQHAEYDQIDRTPQQDNVLLG